LADSKSNNDGKTCYRCAGDPLVAYCTKDKAKLKCTKCSKIGHVAKVCKGPFNTRSQNNKGKGGQSTKPQFAKQAVAEEEDKLSPHQREQDLYSQGEPEYVLCNAAKAREGMATPTLLL